MRAIRLQEKSFGMGTSSFGESQQFEWDENKNELNIKQHCIDFEDAMSVLIKPFLRKRSDRNNEIRYIAVGMLETTEITIVYTMRGEVCRLVSARRARTNERKEYHQTISQGSKKRPN